MGSQTDFLFAARRFAESDDKSAGDKENIASGEEGVDFEPLAAERREYG